MKKQVLLRIDENEYSQIQQGAELFHEKINQFLMRSALLRLQTGQSPQVKDPFAEALEKLRQDRPAIKLSPAAEKALLASQAREAAGTSVGVDSGEALKELRARRKSPQKAA